MGISRQWVTIHEYMKVDAHHSSSTYLQILSLEKEYLLCGRLFRNLLEKEESELEKLVAKTASIGPSSKLEDIWQLLVQPSNAMRTLSGPQEYKHLEVLRYRKLFPINIPPGTAFHYVSASDVKSLWFIVDDASLFQKFRGRVPMLTLPLRVVRSIRELLQGMHLESRLLSNAVKHEFTPRGHPYLHEEYTDRLSSKAVLIER